MKAVVETSKNNIQTLPVADNSMGIAPMVQMVASGQISIDQLDQMMGLQDRYEATEARKLYNKAMALFRSEVPAALKDSQGQNNTYASFGSVMSAINSPLGNNGFNVDFKHDQDIKEGTITVRCTITHEAGHSETTSLGTKVEKLGGANGIQSIGGIVSYLKRYTVSSLTGLATEDDDGRSAEPPPVKEEKPPVEMIDESDMVDIVAVITELGRDPKLWADYWVKTRGAGVGGIPLIAKADKPGVIKNIRDNAAKQSAKEEASNTETPK